MIRISEKESLQINGSDFWFRTRKPLQSLRWRSNLRFVSIADPPNCSRVRAERSLRKKRSSMRRYCRRMVNAHDEINHFRLVSETSWTLILGFCAKIQKTGSSTHEGRNGRATPAVHTTHISRTVTTKRKLLRGQEGSLKDYMRKKNVRLHVTLNQISFFLSASLSSSALS